MKKYLMTVMAAVALGGLFVSCNSVDADVNGGNNSAEFSVVQNYENAFVTRFGQPDSAQTWGFGPAVSGTRGTTIGTPYVDASGKTYNAQMAQAWVGVNAAKATGTGDDKFTDMNAYAAWDGTAWNDQFYDVHGTVKDSELSDEEIAAITKVIVGGDGTTGLIPEGANNLTKAEATGYSIVTTGGPVTLTPVYHNSNSGDRISYYYYPANQKPDADAIKALPKYSLGEISDPQHYGNTHIYKKTYSLVFQKPDGSCTYDFDPNYVINFVISNTYNKEGYAGGTDKIYQEGGITTTIGGSEPTLTAVDKYALTIGETIECGNAVNAPNNKIRIKFSNAIPATTTTTTAPRFSVSQVGQTIWSRSTYTHYIAGNGVNGTLTGGSTCYYFKANETGLLDVAVLMNGGTLKVCEIGSDWNGTGSEPVTFKQNGWSNETNTGVCEFSVEAGKVYAVYAENGVLGYYGYTFLDQYGSSVIEDKPLFSGLGPYDCGTVFDSSVGAIKINVMLGKEATTTSTPDPVNFAAAAAYSIDGYSAYTAGTTENGGYNPGATTYFIRPTEAGVLRVAVRLNANKKIHIEDLGEWGWDNTSGTTLKSEIKDANNPYYGTYDINAEANHVYAVYAEGSKLGFFGCELLTASGGSEATISTSNVVWKNIQRTPDYYSDGDLNEEIHSTTYGYGVGGYGVTDPKTSHTAVFKSKVGDVDYTFVGFEDWIDFDYNDVILAITGTKPEKPQDPIVIPEPEPENTDPAPEGFVCRIIAEDLTVSDNSDFDFNDVVFDVYWSGGVTTIRLLAAGGELPLYIGSVDDAHEVHKLFGFSDSYPLINTNWKNGKTANPVDFTISGSYPDRTACKNIPVYVTKKGENILLKADQGKVASKVCVGRDYEWCDERLDIDKKFRAKDGTKLFQQYVIGKLGDDWDNNKAWYQYKGKELPNE